MVTRKAGMAKNWAMGGFFLATALLAGCAVFDGGQTATSFNVFFPANSTALSPDAEATLAQATEAIRRQRPASVTIAAGADANVKLAEQRYVAVRQSLESRGVAPALMARASLPHIEANAGSTAIQRVEIILSPNP